MNEQQEKRIYNILEAFGSWCYEQGKSGKPLLETVLEGAVIDIQDEFAVEEVTQND